MVTVKILGSVKWKKSGRTCTIQAKWPYLLKTDKVTVFAKKKAKWPYLFKTGKVVVFVKNMQIGRICQNRQSGRFCSKPEKWSYLLKQA